MRKWADLMVTDGQFYWPSVGIFVAAYGQFFMAANICIRACRGDIAVLACTHHWQYMTPGIPSDASIARFSARHSGEKSAS
ncbi:hypothetical protein ARTHRO8AJ_40180 [Arthrobacter sp. 8AJ]|nr:hypothetical protein ARTHRO8AJ_40180 [Arthrobacter sp. 8AJ]